MQSEPATETPDPAAKPLLSPADNAFLCDLTFDLAIAARDFANLLLDRAKHARTGDEVVRLAAAFGNISRAGRRAILLARHLAKPEKPEPTPNRNHPAEPNRPATPQPRETQAEADADASRADPSDRLDPLDPLDQDPTTFEGPVQPIIDGLRRDIRHAFDVCSQPLNRSAAAQNPDADLDEDEDSDDSLDDEDDLDDEDFNDPDDDDFDPLDSS